MPLDPLYPVLRYRVDYSDCHRVAAMAFWTYTDFRTSKNFMLGNPHYQIIKWEFLTEYEIHSEGILFSRYAETA